MSTVEFRLNGSSVKVSGSGSLLDTLREELGINSPKDGCSPQGQCGCCTVWVDGSPRVSCVTPINRVAGRDVTTLEGLDEAEEWAQRFAASAASQCGFCTPGIIMRLASLTAAERSDDARVRRALQAHLCRCTGWQTIVEAASRESVEPVGSSSLADRRATIEGRVPQRLGVATALGQAGFADDTSPPDTPVALRSSTGEWVIGSTLREARDTIGKIQGRRTTTEVEWPVPLPDGDFELTLQTTWVEPGYLEPDASWCAPGRSPESSTANGGAFGGKAHSEVLDVAERLAREHGGPMRALYSREDVVRLGPKRPPLAVGVRADGTGVINVARTHGRLEGLDSIIARWPQFEFREVDVVGPRLSLSIRAAIDAELDALTAALRGGPTFTVSRDGATAEAAVDDHTIHVRVECGQPLDQVVLRSYCIGAAHMAYSWVRSEALRLDGDGVPADLTIRSFGIVKAADTPHISVDIIDSDREPVNGSDAVFAAVAAATWAADRLTPRWPTRL